MRGVLITLIVVLGVLTTRSAHADDALDEGVRQFENAEFEAAIESFGRAEEGDGLSRGEVILLYRTRALVFFALDRPDEMRADLRRLAAVDPTHQMGPEILPQVRAAFEEVRGTPALSLELDATRAGDAVTVTSTVSGESSGLARRVRVHGRAGNEEWLEGESSLEVPAPSDVSVEYYAELVGTGGAVLVERGSASNPLREAAERVEDGELPLVPVLLGVGGVIAVAAIVVIVVLATSGGQSMDTQFGSPMVVRL